MELKLKLDEFAWGQNFGVLSLYSTLNTALPYVDGQACSPGAGELHSRYCQHCSLMAKSKYGCRSLACPRSFLSPTANPVVCARLAIAASNCSWVAALIVSPWRARGWIRLRRFRS